MRALLTFLGFALCASTASLAAEPAVQDMQSWPAIKPAAVRELALCTWAKDRPAAMRLIQQHVAQDGSGDPPQYRFRRSDLAQCGGEAALAIMIADPMEVPDLLTRIWLNQNARCVATTTKFDMKALRSQLLALPEAKKMKRLGDDETTLAGVVTAENLGPEIRAGLAKCDPELARVIETDQIYAGRFFRELEYEAARNA